jgi:opacity protein-like surface antigen
MLVALGRPAAAQGFVSPFFGYNFSGDAGCANITNCEDKHANYGVSVGAIGSVVGFESEFAFTKNFFGASAAQSTDVFTFMANFMLAPKFGPIQLYGLGGPGLIRTHVDSVGQTQDENQVGWDVGGGLIGYFTKHVGIRGDVRYFHSFQLLDLSKFPPISNTETTKLNFGRISIAAMFKF